MVRKVTVKIAPLYRPSVHIYSICVLKTVFHLLTESWIFTAPAHTAKVGGKLKAHFKEEVLMGGKE
jgi:hypothetical protein